VNTRVVMVDGQPLPLLVSPVIPESFAHGFSTRAGGVSAPPYDSFNLGKAWGDALASVTENRRRLRAACGAEAIYCARQVHGAAVVRVRAGDDADAVGASHADAVITDAAGVAVAVFTADCVPLVIADPRTGACAAVHAGWRGVVAGVAGAAIAQLAASFGSEVADLRVALGPCIGACCFEVGPEVVAAFDGFVAGDQRAAVVLERPGRKPHIDLRRALTLQLAALGVPPDQTDAGEECTRCDPQGRFYSYRRDNSRTGQHLGIVVRVAI
jgi:YfiH family protein